MNKNPAQQQVPTKKSQPKKGRALPPRPPIDRFAAWLAQRSRPVRLLIAGLIAVEFTGTIGLFAYGMILTMPPGTFEIGPITTTNFATSILIFLLILGLF